MKHRCVLKCTFWLVALSRFQQQGRSIALRAYNEMTGGDRGGPVFGSVEEGCSCTMEEPCPWESSGFASLMLELNSAFTAPDASSV